MQKPYPLLTFFTTALLALLLSACGVDGDHFRIEGKLKNINQGELLVYSPDKGLYMVDTIKLKDGRFNYETAMVQEATLVLVFPNYFELPVFAKPGGKAIVSGDATHLKEAEVKGGDDNKLMQGFRAKIDNMSDKQIQKVAKQFVMEHPKSVVSAYLINRYFIRSKEADYKTASTLLTRLQKEQPANRYLADQAARMKGMVLEGDKIPTFKFTTTAGKRVIHADLKSELNIISLWASWNNESVTVQRMLRRLKRKYGSRISLLSINIDPSKKNFDNEVKRDTIDWPCVRDAKMWAGKAPMTFGFTTIPDNILTNANGKVIARGLEKRELEKKIDELMTKKGSAK